MGNKVIPTHNIEVPGKVIMHYSNNEQYEGEVLDGLRNGYGTYHYSNGDRYEGKWHKNMKHGKGSFFYNKTGEMYEGMWHNNKRQGVGTFYSKNGDRYYGEWNDNKRHGKGIIYLDDGSKFIGQFKHNKKCGIGELITKNGDIIYEEWFEGKLISQHGKSKNISDVKKHDIDYNELNTATFEKYLESKTKLQNDIKTNQLKSKYFTLEMAKMLKSKNPEGYYDSVRMFHGANNIVMEKPELKMWTQEDVLDLFKRIGNEKYLSKIIEHQINGEKLVNTEIKELSQLLNMTDISELNKLRKNLNILLTLQKHTENLKSSHQVSTKNIPKIEKKVTIEEEEDHPAGNKSEEYEEERKEKGQVRHDLDNEIEEKEIQDEIIREMHLNNLNFLHELTNPSTGISSSVSLNGLNYFINFHEISLRAKVGEGGFGEVFLGDWLGKPVAVKKLTLKNSKFFDNLNKYINEINIISSLRHPNIVLYMGASIDKDNYYMITEYLPKGSLFDYIHRDRRKVSEREQVTISYEIAVAVKYLHSRNIIHCDLKSSNILIDENWKIKIGDFGLSRFFNLEGAEGSRGRIGTPHWMAPEILKGEKYEHSADIFSFGMILWELLSFEIPYYGINPYQVINIVAYQKKIVKVPEEGHKVLRQLVERCLEYEPYKRPSIDEIVGILEQLKNLTRGYDSHMEELCEYLN